MSSTLSVNASKISRYHFPKNQNFKKKIDWIIYRIWNALKHLVGRSDSDLEIKRLQDTHHISHQEAKAIVFAYFQASKEDKILESLPEKTEVSASPTPITDPMQVEPIEEKPTPPVENPQEQDQPPPDIKTPSEEPTSTIETTQSVEKEIVPSQEKIIEKKPEESSRTPSKLEGLKKKFESESSPVQDSPRQTQKKPPFQFQIDEPIDIVKTKQSCHTHWENQAKQLLMSEDKTSDQYYFSGNLRLKMNLHETDKEKHEKNRADAIDCFSKGARQGHDSCIRALKRLHDQKAIANYQEVFNAFYLEHKKATEQLEAEFKTKKDVQKAFLLGSRYSEFLNDGDVAMKKAKTYLRFSADRGHEGALKKLELILKTEKSHPKK